MRIAICSSQESKEISERIAGNLQEKGHTTLVATRGAKEYFQAIEESDALLVADEILSVELGIAMVYADYLGKGIMAKAEPRNEALQHILDKIDVKIIG